MTRTEQAKRRTLTLGTVAVLILVYTLSSCNSSSGSLSAMIGQTTASPTPLQTQTRIVSDDAVTAHPTQTRAVPNPSATPTPTNAITSASATSVWPTAIVTLTPSPVSPKTDGETRQRTHYTLSAHLDYEQHHLFVSQAITYVNVSNEPLTELLLVVEPNRQPGVFHLNKLHWTDGRPIERYALEKATLWLPLPESLLPNTSTSLSLSFELDLPAQSGPFGYTTRQTNLGDWYPFIPPYRAGQGWLVHEPAPVGEPLVYDVANYQIEIYLDNPAANLVVAASTLAETDGNRHRYQLDAARNFTWSVSPEYQIRRESVGSVSVFSYVFPEHLTAGEATARTTVDALALYSEHFAPYPHPSLTVVEADFPDGMEYDGLYFLGKEYYAAYTGSPQGYLTAIAAHETAHQWWYGLVGNDQAIEPWLDETLATYSELLFYQTEYPDLVNWWWRFRVSRYDPAGWVNSTIYDHRAFRPYVNAVYLRGALFMHALRNLIGDEAFFAFLQDYVKRSTYQQVTADDFFAILAEHTSANLSTLMATYFAPAQ